MCVCARWGVGGRDHERRAKWSQRESGSRCLEFKKSIGQRVCKLCVCCETTLGSDSSLVYQRISGVGLRQDETQRYLLEDRCESTHLETKYMF